MLMRNSGVRAVLALLLAAWAGVAAAQPVPLIVTPGSGGTAGPTPGERIGFTGNLGYRFRVRQNPLIIKTLGIYDAGAPGLTQPHTISLYNATNLTTPLASVTLDSTAPGNPGGFIYGRFPEPGFLQLQSYTEWVLLTNYTAVGDAFLDLDDGDDFRGLGSGGLESPDTGARFSIWADSFMGKVNVNDSPTVSGYGGPNMEFVVMPEPATFGLGMVAAVGALAHRRRRA